MKNFKSVIMSRPVLEENLNYCKGSNNSLKQGYDNSFEEDGDENPYMMYANLFPNENEEDEDIFESKDEKIDINIDNTPTNISGENREAFRQFKFTIPYTELEKIVQNSVPDKNPNKPFRYLTGTFMRVFESQLFGLENFKVGIQKRNNILYVDPCRTSTVYLRINGDCKFCPRGNRVRYVFTIKKKPTGIEEFIEVNTKCRGIHNHTSKISFTSEQGYTESPINNSNSNSNSNSDQAMNIEKNPLKNFDESELATLKNSPNKINTLLNNKRFSNGSFCSPNSKNIVFSNKMSVANKIIMLAKRRKLNDSENNNVNIPVYQNMDENGLSGVDHAMISQISNQISAKLMGKLDQINLKVNQISDRLYDLEKKFDNLESIVDGEL